MHTSKDIKETIEKNGASVLLENRWYGIYMITDYQLHHAKNCFELTEPTRLEKVSRRKGELSANGHNSEGDKKSMTDLYNEILAEEEESRINTIMEVMGCSRAQVEIMIAEVLAKIRD